MYEKKTITKALYLFGKGKSVDQISLEMKIPARTIARWLKRADTRRRKRSSAEGTENELPSLS